MKTLFPEISAAALQHKMEGSSALSLIDVRSLAEYRSGHIPGARSVPIDNLNEDKLSQLVKNHSLQTDQPLFITCQAGLRAEKAANMLRDAGLEQPVLLQGGTDAWQKAGLPLKRHGNALSLEQQVQIAIGSLLILKVFFGFTVHELFFVAGAVIGAGLITAGITRWCGLRELLARMPWNRRSNKQANA